MTVDTAELRRKAEAAYGTRHRPASPSEVLALLDRLDTARTALIEIRDDLKPVMTHTGPTNTNRYGYDASQRAREALWQIDGYPDGRGGFIARAALDTEQP